MLLIVSLSKRIFESFAVEDLTPRSYCMCAGGVGFSNSFIFRRCQVKFTSRLEGLL